MFDPYIPARGTEVTAGYFRKWLEVKDKIIRVHLFFNKTRPFFLSFWCIALCFHVLPLIYAS